MAFQASDIINRALARSDQNEADLIATARSVEIISDTQREVYLVAAQEAPEFFGTDSLTATRVAHTDSWDVASTTIAALTSLEVSALVGTVPGVSVGQEVYLVHFRYPELMPSPRAYMRGQKLFGVSTDLGADSSNMVTRLKMYYSPVPTALVDQNSFLTLPDRFVNLLVVPLARKMALADARHEEIGILDAELQATVAMFLGAIKIQAYGAVQPATVIAATQRIIGPQPAGS